MKEEMEKSKNVHENQNSKPKVKQQQQELRVDNVDLNSAEESDEETEEIEQFIPLSSNGTEKVKLSEKPESTSNNTSNNNNNDNQNDGNNTTTNNSIVNSSENNNVVAFHKLNQSMETTLLQCPFCDYRTIVSLHNLITHMGCRDHMAVTHLPKPWTCFICLFELAANLTNYDNIAGHLRLHKGCSHCSKTKKYDTKCSFCRLHKVKIKGVFFYLEELPDLDNPQSYLKVKFPNPSQTVSDNNAQPSDANIDSGSLETHTSLTNLPTSKSSFIKKKAKYHHRAPSTRILKSKNPTVVKKKKN